MYITAQDCRLRNDLYCVEWDVKLYYTIQVQYRPMFESGVGVNSGLISWAASEGSTVSSLICDRWLTRKLATFMG